ncbi:AlbA family DNA-binding domain-containing protein [Micrococcoides hystricis]|uniref:Helix-turn-helix domain-containing protein n=1 Tax=Micrococcoides hystricis TaxID=1572761 RepID=A0ABV6P7C5_9MICC
MSTAKSYREDFARFFEEPSRESFRSLLSSHVGEIEQLDFKQAWPAWIKVARHVLAFANSGGGTMIVGVAENPDGSVTPLGLENLVDKAEIQNALEQFLPQELVFEVLDFSFEESEYPAIRGKKFQALLVEDRPDHVPFLATRDGSGISDSVVYVRRGTSSIAANHRDLQRLINRRIETGHSSNPSLDLSEHLEHLKLLYLEVNRYYTRSYGTYLDTLEEYGRAAAESAESAYPDQSYVEFLVSALEAKQASIRNFLDVSIEHGDPEGDLPAVQ